MTTQTILIAGCGNVGGRLGELLVAQGHRVIGLRRRSELLEPGIIPWKADLLEPRSLANVPDRFGVVVYALSAAARTPEAYEAAYRRGLAHLFDALDRSDALPSRLVFVSSTAVYGDAKGGWVDEGSQATPSSFNGEILLQAEARARSWQKACVVRFSGIYGGKYARMIQGLLRPGPVPVSHRPINRIHRDDCAGFLAHLIDLEEIEPLYLASDDEPASTAEIHAWLCATGRRLDEGTILQGDEASSGAAKRCRNHLLKDSGYVLRYPTFREGYASYRA